MANFEAPWWSLVTCGGRATQLSVMGDNFHITEEMKAKPPGQSDLLGPANCYPPAQPAPDAQYIWPAEDTCAHALSNAL